MVRLTTYIKPLRVTSRVMHLLYEIVRNAGCVVTISWLSVILVGRVFDFHRAYLLFIEQTTSEKWLLEHCQDDHFYHNMAYHTDVCTQVVSNSQISPVLYAINQSMSQMKLCGFYECMSVVNMVYTGGIPVVLCFVLLYVFTPSFLLPVMQNMYDKRVQHDLHTRCSPSLYKSDKQLSRAAPQYAQLHMI